MRFSTRYCACAVGRLEAGGWKIGAKSTTGPIQGAPLPSGDLHSDGARLPRASYPPLGLELEIAFCFARRFEPSTDAYGEAEVLAAIDSIAASIEIVASRYAAWPDVDKVAQLADLQNHGTLIVGKFARYHSNFDFAAPEVRFDFDGQDICLGAPANPAGDPRRLLTWLVNHCTQHCGIAVTPGMILTTGSYTGMFFPPTTGTATGQIAQLPPVRVALL